MAVALASPAAGGTPPTDPWWRSPSVQSTVALAPEQVARLDAIYRETLPARRRLRAQLTGLHARLERVMAEGPFDDTAGRILIERVFEVEKQRNIARTIMLLRMYRVLTTEQRNRLASIGVHAFP